MYGMYIIVIEAEAYIHDFSCVLIGSLRRGGSLLYTIVSNTILTLGRDENDCSTIIDWGHDIARNGL